MFKLLAALIKLASFFFGLSQDNKQKALNEANKAIIVRNNKRVSLRERRRARIEQLLEEQRVASARHDGKNIVQQN